MSRYYTLLTEQGMQGVARSINTQNPVPVQLSHIKVSDANGDTSYMPSASQTDLVGSEKTSIDISNVQYDDTVENWLIVEGILRESEGGFVVREVGLFAYDAQGGEYLFAIANYPDVYKPAESEGSSASLTLRMVVSVGADSEIDININSGDYATIAYVNALDTLNQLSTIQGHTLALGGDLTVSLDSKLNQDVSTTSTPRFNALNLSSNTLNGHNLQSDWDKLASLHKENKQFSISTMTENGTVEANRIKVSGGASTASVEFYTQGDSKPAQVVIRGDLGFMGVGIAQPSVELDVKGTVRADHISYSDARLKKNVEPIENALNKVVQLQGVSFEWKDDAPVPHTKLNKRFMGLIAQEVNAVLPEVIHRDGEGHYNIHYQHLIAVLIEAIKEQQWEINQLKNSLLD